MCPHLKDFDPPQVLVNQPEPFFPKITIEASDHQVAMVLGIPRTHNKVQAVAVDGDAAPHIFGQRSDLGQALNASI